MPSPQLLCLAAICGLFDDFGTDNHKPINGSCAISAQIFAEKRRTRTVLNVWRSSVGGFEKHVCRPHADDARVFPLRLEYEPVIERGDANTRDSATASGFSPRGAATEDRDTRKGPEPCPARPWREAKIAPQQRRLGELLSARDLQPNCKAQVCGTDSREYHRCARNVASIPGMF